jgi:O-antigen ligase
MSKDALDRWQRRVVGLILGATVVLLPLVFVSTGFDPFRFPKVLVVRTAAVLLLTIHAARFLWSGGAWRVLLHDRLFQIAAFIVGWCALSAIVSPQPSVSWWAVGDVVAGLTLFFAARAHMRRTGSKVVLWLVLSSGIIVSAVVLLQTLDLWHPLLAVQEVDRLSQADQIWLKQAGLLGNRNDVGLYLVVPLAVGIALLSRSPLPAAIGSLVVMGGVMLSKTLTAIGVALMVSALYAVLWVRSLERGRLAAGAAVMIVGLTVVLLAGMQPGVKERLPRYLPVLKTGEIGGASGGRHLSFSVAAQLTKQNPLVGVGPGRFSMEFTATTVVLRSKNPEIIDDPGLMGAASTYFDMVHNDYLETAAEAGIPALLGMLAMAGFYLRRMASGWRDLHSDVASVANAGTLATLGIGVAALAQFPLQIAAVYGTLAIIAGGSLGYVERSEV